MRKQTIQYTSSLDALIAVAKRLSVYENQHKMDSEDFYGDRYSTQHHPQDALILCRDLVIF